jgi:O-glycosyl hydrolase
LSLRTSPRTDARRPSHQRCPPSASLKTRFQKSIGIAAALFCFAGFSRAASAQDATINWTDTHQTIDGFGAAAAFSVYNSMTDAQADHFFSTTAGIGLSLLRIQINSDGTTADLVTAQKAQARGARVWGTPWSPPAAWKSNDNVDNGGTLLPAHYQDWANSLTSFVKSMTANGVNIYAVSVQNEPDFVATYDSAQYSGQQFHDFIAVLGPTFASNGITSKIMLPETSDWDTMPSLTDTTLNDAATAKYVGIAATHAYGGTYAAYPNAQSRGIPLWETEVSDFNTYDGSIGSGLTYAKQIHTCMTVAGCTAWHYWWLKASSTNDNEGLQSNAGVDSYRYWAMGNFARFVRPGMQRIGVTGAPSGVSVSAYKDASGNYAIVAINSNAGASTFNLILNGVNTTSMTPWETSSTFNLAAQHAIPVSGSSVSVTLDAQSITTFVGSGTAGAPTATPPTITTQPASKSVTAGATATFTVAASGTAPFTYQWTKNGAAISGATAASYTTPATTTADSGSVFAVKVTNSGGSAQSANATLTVAAAGGTTTPGTQLIAINAGGPGVAPFAADTGFSGGQQFSTTNTVSTASATSPAPAAVYQTERYGAMTYTLGGLTAGTSYVLRLHFAEVFWTATGQRLFNVSVNGAAALTNFDIFAAAGGANKAVIEQFNATANASGQIVVGFTVGSADQPKISGLEVTTSGTAPTATAPSITTQPASRSVTAGATATFSVAASGTAPFTYQWKKGGTAISGATAASYTTPATTTADSGSVFSVVVTNSAGSATSGNATLTVTAAATAPAITTQPASKSVTAGATATFSVAASGTAPFTYQWTKNGAAISGATAASYTTPATTTADSGSTFAVKVTNSAGSATSANATLTVTAAATAGSQVVAIGSGSSAASGTFKADTDVSGGTMYTPNPTGTITTTGVTNPAPLAVYKNERYGAFTYTVPGLTPGATYNVRLHFVEIFWTASGKRNFNVAINGTKVLNAFDIFATAGGSNKVTIQQFSATANASGQIVITYSNGTADQPKSSAIEITQ